MRQYEDFGVCTKQALVYASHVLGIELSEEEQEKLIEEYQNLRPFPGCAGRPRSHEVERSYLCRVQMASRRRRGRYWSGPAFCPTSKA